MMDIQSSLENEEANLDDNILGHKTENGLDSSDGLHQAEISSDNSSPPPALVMQAESGDCDKAPNHDQNQSPNQGSNNNVSPDEAAVTGKRRVRFSVCEYITETLVQENGVNGSHSNPAFEDVSKSL